MRLFLLIVFFFCFNSCQLLSSKKKEPSQRLDTPKKQKQRKKLGLFISGAGVHTFSSLSLLELLQNIHFDFTAGTGWGAWLAALYAKNQSVDELKWNLFKLQEQGIFETKWFDNKKTRTRLLKTLIEETLPSSLQTSFTCPVLDKKGHVSWLREKTPVHSLLSCLNSLPPLFFSFDNREKQGSLFSAESTMKYMGRQGIDIIIWVKPFFHPKLKESNKLPSLFWKELFSHLNEVQKKILHLSPQINPHGIDFSNELPRLSSGGKKGKTTIPLGFENTGVKKLAIKRQKLKRDEKTTASGYKNFKQTQYIILKTPASSVSLDDFSKINAIMKTPPPLSEKKKIDQLKHLIEKRIKNEETF
ncbi:MAG: hypothetical protein OXM55_05350 [Bdellovibrionales bacterium]|nr:hypothetical protein [Bdellovibrionales bacterium]